MAAIIWDKIGERYYETGVDRGVLYTYDNEANAYEEGVAWNGLTTRQQFGFAWRSKIGSDTQGNNAGSKIHIAYNALAQPSEKGYTTINDSPEAMTLSWTFSTTPLAFPSEQNPDNLAPTSYISIDSREVSEDAFAELTEALWGSEAEEPTLLMPWEILAIVRPGGAG